MQYAFSLATTIAKSSPHTVLAVECMNFRGREREMISASTTPSQLQDMPTLAVET